MAVEPPNLGRLGRLREVQRRLEGAAATFEAARMPADVVAAVGRCGLLADGASLRRGAAQECHVEGGFRAPQRGSGHDDGSRLRRVVGRHRRDAAQGEAPGGDAAVLECVLRQGVPGRAARVAARRHRVGVRLLWRRGRADGAGQHLAGGQGDSGRSGPRADRGVRGVPGR